MIDDPPVEPGAEKATLNDCVPGVTELIVGAPAVVDGVAETEFEEAPFPTVFTALINTS